MILMKIAMPKDGEMLNQHFGQSKNFLIASVENQLIIKRQEISSESNAGCPIPPVITRDTPSAKNKPERPA